MRLRIKQARPTVFNKTIIENSGVRKCWAESENKGYYWTIGNSEKGELSELTKLIENTSTENAFTKEEKIFYEEKEVSNHSMISLSSGLKEIHIKGKNHGCKKGKPSINKYPIKAFLESHQENQKKKKKIRSLVKE